MTDKSAEVEPQAAPVDNAPDELRSWGLSNRPLRMAPNDWQPLVAALRDVNVGKSPAASAQPLLDAAFPGKGYQAADLVVGGVPKGTFTYTTDNVPKGQRTFTADDAGLKLPFEHYQWDFGDGYRGSGAVASHVYTQRGRYNVVLTVNMAGQVWSSSQAVPALGGPLPTITSISPKGVVLGSPDLTVSVKGTEFVSGKTDIYVGETKRTTTFVSPTEVTTVVTPSNPLAPQPGTLPVSVLVTGVGRSNAVGFDVFPAGTSIPTTTTFAEPDEPAQPKDDDKIVVEGEVVGTREPEEPQVMQGGGDVLMPGAGMPESEPGELFMAEQPGEADAYDPADHTVDEVVEYAGKHPDDVDSLIGQEETGKARSTLLDKLHAMSADATS